MSSASSSKTRMGRVWLILTGLLVVCAPVQAIQLQVEAGAIEKLLKSQVFRDDGK